MKQLPDQFSACRLVYFSSVNCTDTNLYSPVLQAPGVHSRIISVAVASIFTSLFIPSIALAAAAAAAPTASMKFDNGFFGAGTSTADLSRFEKSNVIQPGTYRVDMIVNDRPLGRRDIIFSAVPDQDSAVACFDKAMLIQLGVDPAKVARGDGTRSLDEVAKHQIPDGTLCGDISTWIPGATLSFNTEEQIVTISIPQIYTNRSARGYVDPSQLDSGVTAAILGYTIATSAETQGGSGSQTYVGLNGGVNVGDWRLRHQGAQSFSSQNGRAAYQNTATYLQRDITALKSQLIVGDAFTDGQIMDSARLRGVSLASDDRQTPQSQQGYAPVVRGIAESNARVSISQNGYTIYETTVAPGPFVIDDLYPTGYGGDLIITVLEADGRKNSFTVPYAAVPQLLRPGVTKYSMAAGQLQQYGVTGSKPFVMQATLQHGFNNTITGYGGITAASGYTQAKLGTAVSTAIGALSFDVSVSSTQLPASVTGNRDKSSLNGQSLGIVYNKNMPETGTNFALGAYRFSSSGYLGLQDAVNMRDLSKRGEDTTQISRQKSRLNLNVNQAIGTGSAFLAGSSTDFWGGSGRQTSFSAGYGNRWKQVSWNLTAQRIKTQAATPTSTQQEQADAIFFGNSTAKSDNRITLTLSMPLGNGSNAPNLNSNFTHGSSDSSSGNNLQVGINGNMGDDRVVNYGISGSANNNNGRSSNNFNANAGYQTSVANLRAGFSQSGGNGQSSGQISFSADGGIVAHPKGVSFANGLSDTIGIIDAPDAEGARISSSLGIRVDGRGHAVVPYLQPYQYNTVEIDPKGMSDDVEFKETTQTTAPRLGSVVMLKYSTDSARAIVVKTVRENGKPLPFAAEVYDEQGQVVGVIGQAGKAFVRVQHDSGILTVKWGQANDSQCQISYALPAKVKNRVENGRMADVVEATCAAEPSAQSAASEDTLMHTPQPVVPENTTAATLGNLED